MSAIQLISCYVGAHLLITAAAALLGGLRTLSRRLPRPLSYRDLLLIGRLLAVGALCLPLLALGHGSSALSPVRAQVWAAPSMYVDPTALSQGVRIELGLYAAHPAHAFLSAKAAGAAALGLFMCGVVVTLLRLIPEARATFQAIREAHPLRSIGCVRLRVSDTNSVPFAAWIPGRCFIVVPAALLLRPADLRLALRHEIQHHRQRDTRYLYGAVFWRALFGLNPAVHWLARQLNTLQEFACDEALAQRPGHCPDGYGACLLRVAENTTVSAHARLRACMSGHDGGELARRIEAVMRGSTPALRAPAVTGISLLAAALLAALSAVMTTPVLDQRLSRADAERLAANASGLAAAGLTVNDAVLRQLNLLLGTPDGRAFLSASIVRMRQYEPSLLSALQSHGLPPQLLAVPLVESGYRNLPARSGQGAGLWMFIARTARHYGLQVCPQRDERLNVRAETGAAVQMLSDLWRQFGDWPLALMAYNAGASDVEDGIRATHSRNAWTLYQAGYGNDPDYLARTTAAMLLLAQRGRQYPSGSQSIATRAGGA